MNIRRPDPRFYLTIRSRYVQTVTTGTVCTFIPCVGVSAPTDPGTITPWSYMSSPNLPAGK